MEHKWVSAPGGEWFDCYVCAHCKLEVVVDAEDALQINEKTIKVKEPCLSSESTV